MGPSLTRLDEERAAPVRSAPGLPEARQATTTARAIAHASQDTSRVTPPVCASLVPLVLLSLQALEVALSGTTHLARNRLILALIRIGVQAEITTYRFRLERICPWLSKPLGRLDGCNWQCTVLQELVWPTRRRFTRALTGARHT
jgi:hypothetical protein